MWSRVLAKVRILFRQEQVHQEIAAEREFHLAMAAEDEARRGLSGEEATTQVAHRFGHALPMHEDAFAAKGGGLLSDSYSDLRFALRILTKSPTRTATLVATLALGIGVNVADFTALKAVVFDALPFEKSGALVTIHQISKDGLEGVSYPNFEDWRVLNKSFESMAVYASDSSALRVGDRTQRAYGAIISANLFRLLAVHPLRGKLFGDSEDQPHSPHNILISDRLWQTRFQRRADIVGQTLALDGARYRIIGVLAERAAFPIQNDGVDYWVTVSIDAETSSWGGSIRKSRGFPRYDAAIARLRSGCTLAQAQAEMKVISGGIARQHSQFDLQRGVQLRPAKEDVAGKVRPLFWILFGATCCVWAISCSNAATLLLVEALGRAREFALRASLGAARTRLIRQTLVESLTLSLMGGLAGVALASGLLAILRTLAALEAPRLEGACINGAVLAYAFGASVLAGLIFGLMPSLVAARCDLAGSLKQVARYQFSGSIVPKALRFQPGALLILGQVALSMVLCCSAAVLTSSFWNILHEPRGFDSSQVLTAAIALPGGAYPAGSPKVTRFYYGLLDKIRTLPGVTSASVAQSLPLSGQNNSTQIEIIDGGTPRNTTTNLRFVDPSYFRTLRIPLLRGNGFTVADNLERPPVGVVNEEFVRRFIRSGNPLTARVLLGWGGNAAKTIIGVVGGIRHAALQSQIAPEIYVPIAQFPVGDLSLLIRTAVTMPGLPQHIRDIVRDLDVNVTVDHIRTLDEYLLLSAAPQRLLMWILILFSTNALVLAAVGLYGSLSYATLLRKREFGIRMALGSPSEQVAGTVMRNGLALVGIGVVLGLLLTVAIGPMLRAWLFQTSSVDVKGFAAASLVLLGVTAIACWLPARRVALADPAETLRSV